MILKGLLGKKHTEKNKQTKLILQTKKNVFIEQK